MSWVRILRGAVLGSIALGAALGIIALLGADLGEPGWKVVGTSFLVTGAALVALPSVAALDRERLGWLPSAGIVSSVFGFGWMVVGIWAEFDSDVLWKIPSTLIVAAAAIAGVALMEFARLPVPQEWLATAVRLSIAAVALLLTIGIWAEPDSGAYWRIFGVAAVVMAAFLAAVPVLHRSAKSAGIATHYCPICGVRHDVEAGVATACPECGQRYHVVL